MRKFIICIHNHQPVGNFDEVFEKALREAYLPFIQTLKEFPSIKVALHNSGPIFEYLLEKNRRDYLDLIQELLEKKQLELLSGGFYEPILPLIPEDDIKAQVTLMNRFLRERFHVEPRGLWLAERVWESNLVKPLAGAGLEYTLVDDYGFYKIGFKEEDLTGYFITEDEGYTLKLFPISKRLRYMIPASSPEEVIQFLRNFPDQDAVLVYGDDGEKFGLWPGTSDRLYRQGWLRRFLEILSRDDEIKTVFPSEALGAAPPKGRVYLPPSSYEEMEEWSLPPQEQVELKRKKSSLDQESRRFLRGGYFQNFLAKYAESNKMHKRMLFLRSQLQQEKGEALTHYLRGQCNCAYWHGVFGGLYFPFLREAIYRELLRAESHLSLPEGFTLLDFDKDGLEEAVFQGKAFDLIFHKRGGRVLEWDDRLSFLNLTNVMTHYLEAYHLERGENIPSSISRTGAQGEVFYDLYTKESFLDHFLDSPQGYRRSLPQLSLYQEEVLPPATLRYRSAGILLKEYVIQEQRLLLNLEVERRKPYYMLELNFSCLKDWRPLQEKGTSLSIPFSSFRLQVELSREALFQSEPIYTVSSSEAGLEKIYQGTSLFLIFPLPEERNRMQIVWSRSPN